MQMMYACNVYARILKQRRTSRYPNPKKLKNVKAIGAPPPPSLIPIASFCRSKKVLKFTLKMELTWSLEHKTEVDGRELTSKLKSQVHILRYHPPTPHPPPTPFLILRIFLLGGGGCEDFFWMNTPSILSKTMLLA